MYVSMSMCHTIWRLSVAVLVSGLHSFCVKWYKSKTYDN